MTYSIKPKGVCSTEMHIEIDENNVIQSLQVTGGCSGNLQAIGILLKGMSAREAADKLNGIKCKFKSTSCADQLAKGIEEILSKEE